MNTTSLIITITILLTGLSVSVVTIVNAVRNAKKIAQDRISKNKNKNHYHAIEH